MDKEPAEIIEKRKKTLTKREKEVLFDGRTEAPFSGELLREKREGIFQCKVCGTPLFASDAKFDSRTGWPSFDRAIAGSVEYVSDNSMAMKRTEARCAFCHAHLGHIFDDGPTKTGKRFCINSICLDFKNKKK
jgi:peptide-methionine (R)-S-oxide reductase